MALPAKIERYRINVYGGERNDLSTVAVAVSSMADQLTMAQAAIIAATNSGDFKGDSDQVYSAMVHLLADVAETLDEAAASLDDMNGDES